MHLLDRRNRAHPEDGVDAPRHSEAKRCPRELRAEQAVRAYFSLDKTRPVGVAAYFLDILAYPPKDRVPQFMFMAEMMSISTGLLLFFVQTLATFEEGMSKLGLVSAAMATAAVLIFISVSLMMFGITASKMSSSVKHVVALGEAIVAPAVGFVYGCYLSIVAFALHALDSVGGNLRLRVSNAGERILLYRHEHLHQRGAPVVPPVVLESDGFRQRHRVDRVGPALPDRTRVARARRSDAGAPRGRLEGL